MRVRNRERNEEMVQALEELLIELLKSAGDLPHGPERQAALKEIGCYAARLGAIKTCRNRPPVGAATPCSGRLLVGAADRMPLGRN